MGVSSRFGISFAPFVGTFVPLLIKSAPSLLSPRFAAKLQREGLINLEKTLRKFIGSY